MTDTREREGLSARLAAHISQVRFEQLPPSTVHAASRAVLDAVGVISAASALAPEARAFIELARDAATKPEASVLGTDIRAPAAMAALANGAMSHALDYEDAFDAAPVHPNASLVPAVLAIAQARAPTSGRELLTAIATGCDVACRLALSLRRPLEAGGWYPPPILAAFGAVAGASRLLRLSPRQVQDAFSLLLLQNCCPSEIKHSADSVIRAVREAFPAQAAVTAAFLAERGVRGFDAPLEGRGGFYALFAGNEYDPSALFADLGQRWFIEDLSFKAWPSCRGTHAAIESALALRDALGDRRDAITAITIDGGSIQSMLAEPLARKAAPATAIDAKFSLPFTVATALVHGSVELDHFSPRALQDEQVRSLASRCRYRLWEHGKHDNAVAGAVTLHLEDGRCPTQSIIEPLGAPGRPLDDARLLRKATDCLQRAAQPLAARAAERLARAWLDVAHCEDVASLFRPA